MEREHIYDRHTHTCGVLEGDGPTPVPPPPPPHPTSQLGVLTDALAAFERIVGGDVRATRPPLRAEPSKVVVWGHSLGGGVAVQLVRMLEERHGGSGVPRGLILESTFTSIVDYVS